MRKGGRAYLERRAEDEEEVHTLLVMVHRMSKTISQRFPKENNVRLNQSFLLLGGERKKRCGARSFCCCCCCCCCCFVFLVRAAVRTEGDLLLVDCVTDVI